MSKNTDLIRRKIPYLSGDPNWSDVMKAMIAEFEEKDNAIAGLRLQVGRIQKRAKPDTQSTRKEAEPLTSGAPKGGISRRKP